MNLKHQFTMPTTCCMCMPMMCSMKRYCLEWMEKTES